MLNEPASSLDDDHPQQPRAFIALEPQPQQRDTRYTEIRDAVESVMDIESEDFSLDDDDDKKKSLFLLTRDSQLLMTFTGRLLTDSEEAYTTLDGTFSSHDLLPIFRQEEGKHVIHVLEGRVEPAAGGGWLSLILFLSTVISVLFVGSQMAISEIASTNMPLAQSLAQDWVAQLWRGWPYATSILLILGAHELGHYFLARYHKTAASLPYFLPFPLGIFGTFGAAIRLREPMRNRKVLMDIGAAGPLAGMVFAIPIVLIGLATSQVGTIQGGYVEGNSVLYALAKVVVFGRFLPDGTEDVFVNQMAWAGWTGLLVTGLNLIPVGQLDGGHVLYSLLGKRAKNLYYPIIGALLLLTVFVANELFVFVLLILLMGNTHAVPLDDITPLDKRRRTLALVTLGIFFLVFVPTPLTPVSVPDGGGGVNSTVWMASVGLMSVWVMRHRVIEWWQRRVTS